MSSIIDKTYLLIDALDESSLIKDLTRSKNILENDEHIKDIIHKINNETNLSKKQVLKEKLYQNETYRLYASCYNELSLIVLRINHQYAVYTNTKDK